MIPDNQEGGVGLEDNPLASTIERVKVLYPLNITKPSEIGTVRDEFGKILPGHTLNPGGRPKGPSLSSTCALKLQEAAGTGRSICQEIAEILAVKSLQGDTKAIELLHDYAEGKPVARTELSGVNGGPVEVNHQALLLGKIEQMISNNQPT